MPPKRKPAPKQRIKASARASAKNTTRVTTVVNVAAPRKRASRPTKRPAAPVAAPLIYQQPPVYLPQPLVVQNGPYELRQAAVLEDIKRDVAALKKEPVVVAANPLYDMPSGTLRTPESLRSPAPSIVTAKEAERAVARGAPSVVSAPLPSPSRRERENERRRMRAAGFPRGQPATEDDFQRFRTMPREEFRAFYESRF